MLFRQPRLKVERANKHIYDVQAVILSVLEGYTAIVEDDGETGGQILRYVHPQINERLEEISLTSGDAIHNLRTSLDYAWIEIICGLGLSETSYTKFPFSKSADALTNALKTREIDVACPMLYTGLLNDIKPYDGGDNLLWGLHELDITDKHRLLLTLDTYGAASGICFENDQGELEVAGSMLLRGGPISFFIPKGAKLKSKGIPGVNIFFQEGFVCGSVFEELLTLSTKAQNTICALEGLVQGCMG